MSSVIPSSSTTSTATPSSSLTSATAAGGSLVTSTGIGSGLDIGSIVSSLTTAAGAAENNQLAAQKSTLNAELSAYGTFSSALETLQAALTPLETTATLAGRTAALGDTTIATATATGDAVPAQYSLAVQNLATAASLSSQPLTTADSTVGTGTLTISIGGNSSSINIDGTDNSLSGIANAINSAPDNPGVTANILTTTAGARLVLSGSATGTANAITVTQSGGDGGLAALVYNPASGTTVSSTALTETQAAQDANFTLNGYAATSAGNQVSSAITGVTLNLLKASAASTTTPPTYTPTTLTIGNDTTGAQTSIGTFATALNGLITAVQSLTAYDATTQTAGPLQGNATLQSFQNQLQKILGQVVSGNLGGLNSLSSLGITANPDGSYASDTTKLGNALTSSVSSVAAVLGGTGGIATQLNTLINQYTQAGGLLSTINQGLQTGLQSVATQQTALNARLSTYSATLTQQYNAMDTAVALLKQTQNFLTAQFNASSSNGGTSSTTSLGSGNLSTGG
jgi:flagellar hook-associated protein 2